MIKLIGTHHLEEKETIRKHIEDYNPDVILVELCNGRITMIEHPELAVKRFSLLQVLVNLVKKKAEEGGKSYGNDMISAYKIAREKEIPVGLIDRPLIETQVFFKAIPFSEKVTLIKEMFKFSSKKITTDKIIESVNDDDSMKKVIAMFKDKLPNLYYYLVTARDEYMLAKIKAYLYDFPDKKILCFVGKGHLEYLKEKLKLE
jgi:pheromone shutdown protein TraB